MTDNLRDRIAAVMEAHDVNSDCGCPGPITNWFDHLADAVIAELETGYVLVPKSHTIATAVTGRRDCNPHPDAPHGFDRNASHSEDRYVCDCEGWVPPDPWEERAADERKDWADD